MSSESNKYNESFPQDCSVAFKEWAVVCRALQMGRQTIILRKGGIHEGRDGFRVEHRHFWLFPTEFHQRPDVLSKDARDLLEDVQGKLPPVDMTTLHSFVSVDQVIELRDESRLNQLSPFHIWSEETVHQRFHYRTPGLFCLLVRVFNLACPVSIPILPGYAGCRSWVEMEQPHSTAALSPVLPVDEYSRQLNQIRNVL